MSVIIFFRFLSECWTLIPNIDNSPLFLLKVFKVCVPKIPTKNILKGHCCVHMTNDFLNLEMKIGESLLV